MPRILLRLFHLFACICKQLCRRPKVGVHAHARVADELNVSVITRRDLLKTLTLAGIGSTAGGGYAVAESFGEKVTRYQVTPTNWTPGLNLRLAVLADLHVCEPWMSLERLAGIVEQTNALGADAVLLLGDYVVGHGLGKFSTPVTVGSWATVLANLKAPLGVHAVLGNHDWWDELEVQLKRKGPTRAGLALSAVGIPVYENNVLRLKKDGHAFWLAGLGDQWAFWPTERDFTRNEDLGPIGYIGVHDLPGTLRQVTDDAPVILMAHEPDIFADVPDRVSVTVSGHTHGGQIQILGYRPVVPSRFGSRFAYGHIIEQGRNLVVSGGLGCSKLPVRFGCPPEIVLIDVSAGVGV